MLNINDLPWTGERYLTEIYGGIELEHLHRYFLARSFVAGKDVLDIASGEGYGSALISERAKSVTGVDISSEAIEHAKAKYQKNNLTYLEGSCAKIPLADGTMDLVISFETIEHHEEHEAMMREIKRVLKPDGILIISCPDKLEYSDKPAYSNPYHKKELYREEFEVLIKKYFTNYVLAGQRLIYGSAIVGEGNTGPLYFLDRVDAGKHENRILPGAVYLIAIATNNKESINPIPTSTLLGEGISTVEFYFAINPLVKKIDELNKDVAKLDRAAFDEELYLAENPDIAEAIQDGKYDSGYSHFKEIGSLESRVHSIQGLLAKLTLDNKILADANVDLHSELENYKKSSLFRLANFYKEDASKFQAAKKMSLKPLAYIKKKGIIGFFKKATDVSIKKIKGSLLTKSWYIFNKRSRESYLRNSEIFESNSRDTYNPLVTVIVPNYNHSKFLRRRLDSIYQQSYSNFEVILLDDGSTDESVEILREYAECYPEKTKCYFNSINSGGVFKQWKRGIELANSKLIWIAESDDYCSNNFLEELIPFFKNSVIRLAFSRTDFIEGDSQAKIWDSEDYLSDLCGFDWKKKFIKTAHQMVCNGWTTKNIIPNASAAIFRCPEKLDLLNSDIWSKLTVCGDWMFYLSIIRGGAVAYSPSATNFYQQHPQNISVNTQKEDIYYQEHETVGLFIAENYAVDRNALESQKNHLYSHWCSRRGREHFDRFQLLYDEKKILSKQSERKPNILMVSYALVAGGGEIFPINLANLLFERGYAVTFLNAGEEPTEPEVKNMLHADIALLEISDLKKIDYVCTELGIEIIHSHHASMDVSISSGLIGNKNVKQIVTLHGMYETFSQNEFKFAFNFLSKRVDAIVYTATKNLEAFPLDFRRRVPFIRINNALPIKKIELISRAHLQIKDSDFVVCMVARGISEKGWSEAIDAVSMANRTSKRPIHLLAIGSGPELEKLYASRVDKHIHFLGFRSNIQDYFALSDAGLIPSRFSGESFPLVLIECLNVGKPVVASDIGEIPNMLLTENGCAGKIFKLSSGKIPIEKLANILDILANDLDEYQKALSQVTLAAKKFDTDYMVNCYASVYKSALLVNKKKGS